MKITKYSLGLALLIICSCTEQPDVSTQNENYFFHLKEAGSYLPVWVRGNVASNNILVYIQGGPGLNTIDFATVDYAGWEETLEKDFAIAYYDQRGMGNAQGDFDMETITLDQYLLDLRKIVQVLQQQYPDAAIHLFGHSFGGWLAYLYATTFQEDPLVEGIIAANAPFTTDHNEIRWTFRHAFLQRVAEDFIEKAVEVEYWQEVLNWTLDHPLIDDIEEKRQWNRYVINGLSDYEVDPPISTGKILKGVFASSINVFPTLLSQDRLDEVADLIFEDQAGIELLEQLATIQLPLLMITGSYDDIAPTEELEYALDQLGSTVKQLEELPEAGHDAMINQPELFRQVINDFIQ